MGVEIVAISRARLVPCTGSEECDETHYSVGSYPKRRDGLKPGCYVVGKGGRTFGFRAGTYVGYGDFRRQLSLLALGVEPEEVWEHPRRFRGKPFVELIDFPDGVGPTIGPKTSAKLHRDFVAWAAKAKRHYASPQASIEPPRRPAKPHVNRAGELRVHGLVQALGGTPGGGRKDTDLTWMWEVYRDFRKAFKLASDGGFVSFE